MSQSSTVLLPDTNGKWNVTGEAIRADAYWGAASTTHTIAVHLHKFTGHLWIEASLAEQPEDADWFAIHIGDSTPHLECRDTTAVVPFTVQANVAWFRARVDRGYLGQEPTDWAERAGYGVVRQVLLNN